MVDYPHSPLESTHSLIQNYLIFTTHRRKYALIYMSPLLIMFIIMIMQSWVTKNFTWEYPEPSPYQLQPIPKCYGEDCLTLGIVYEGKKEPYMDTVISYVRTTNHLDTSDIREMPIASKDVMHYLQNNPNKTQLILVFCSNSSWQVGNLSIPCYA